MHKVSLSPRARGLPLARVWPGEADECDLGHSQPQLLPPTPHKKPQKEELGWGCKWGWGMLGSGSRDEGESWARGGVGHRREWARDWWVPGS